MTFTRLRLLVSVMALAAHSMAAPSVKFVAATTKSVEDKSAAQVVRDTLVELTAALMTESIDDANGRKSEVYHHGHEHKHHHAISTIIHLLLTIGSAFAPLVGAVIGPLLTNIANGITWAITNTIASGFSSPHGLLSLNHGHGIEHIKEHVTSYTAEGQPGTALDTFQVQQPIDAAAAERAEPATVDDIRNEVKKT